MTQQDALEVCIKPHLVTREPRLRITVREKTGTVTVSCDSDVNLDVYNNDAIIEHVRKQPNVTVRWTPFPNANASMIMSGERIAPLLAAVL